MSLKPQPIGPVPELTAYVAHAAFPDANIYMRLRDELGPLYEDQEFAKRFPERGQPALSPGRLVLVTLMQFLENLSDRQAADAVRARIDWKYALGLELTDPDFEFSALSAFRTRLVAGGAERLLLDRMLKRLRDRGLVKAWGRQRTDATHVLAAIRVLNRLELVGESLRAALNQLATAAPEWTRGVARPEWFERYSRRIEDSRLPKGRADRESYAHVVGVDGFALLDALDADEAAAPLRALPAVPALCIAWTRHFERTGGQVRWKADAELPRAAEGIESPYDPEARYRTKRDTHWTGSMVHLTETCDEGDVHLITNVMTTTAAVHEARCTEPIQDDLVAKELPPAEHLVDAAYVDAELLVSSRREHGIDLVGPPRPDASWQSKVEGAYDSSHFAVDWEARRVPCPEGKVSSSWTSQVEPSGAATIAVKFRVQDCAACAARALCARAKRPARGLKLYPRAEHEALRAARARLESEEGKRLYQRRAGVEVALSQGVRAFGLRRCRYLGLAKAHLQHVITAGAMNLARLAAWFEGVPQCGDPCLALRTASPLGVGGAWRICPQYPDFERRSSDGFEPRRHLAPSHWGGLEVRHPARHRAIAGATGVTPTPRFQGHLHAARHEDAGELFTRDESTRNRTKATRPESGIHPTADHFPGMHGRDFESFTDHIAARGLRDPLVVHEGQIIDGRNRYRACRGPGIGPTSVARDGEGTILDFVIGRDLRRRHLTEGQRAATAARLTHLAGGRPAKTA